VIGVLVHPSMNCYVLPDAQLVVDDQELEINENPVGVSSALDPLESPSLARLTRPYQIVQGVET
jgi:hypothetical protein